MGGRGSGGRSRATAAGETGAVPATPDSPPTPPEQVSTPQPEPAAPEPTVPEPIAPEPATPDGTEPEPTTETEPEPAVPEPVSGRLLKQELLDNDWGRYSSPDVPISYHEDGEIGRAIKKMGWEARLDVDGEPLGDVLGKLATDVVRGKKTPQEGADAVKQLRDRMPADSLARQSLGLAAEYMDAPATPAPVVPAGTPEPLRRLVDQLHSIPIVRAEPDTELEPVLRMCQKAAAGRSGVQLADQLNGVANRRHESDGDRGKFAIDRAVRKAIEELTQR